MKSVIDILEEKITTAMTDVSGEADSPAIVRPATDPKFGDYQANGVMALAKKLKTNPRKLAEQVAAKLDVSDICEPLEIAGPGFINLRIKTDYLAAQLLEIKADVSNRLAIEETTEPKTIVVDFSSPNIAKQMHVGHLRSTIIGDCICRLLEFCGHKVIRQNHIGDWGTQFGKVILGLWHMCMGEHRKTNYYIEELDKLKTFTDDKEKLKKLCRTIRDRDKEDWEKDFTEEVGDGNLSFQPFLDKLRQKNKNELWQKILKAYQYVSTLDEVLVEMDLDIPTRKKENGKYIVITIPYKSLTKRTTAMLQEGGDDNKQERDAWEFVRDITINHCQEIYDQLEVTLRKEHVRSESEYNDRLPDVVKDLKKTGAAVESDGAICVFPPGFKNKDGDDLPFIIQKSDGAYLYATTDLAAIRYRVNELKADKIVYVTDARQKLHFEMLFSVAQMAKWAEGIDLSHVMFGSVLGENGKPLKTRTGENVKLKDLLDEAIERARVVVEQKNPDLPAKKKAQIAKAVGIGAIKYADYFNNRTSDYVFSFDKMLAMEGNTAPYMQYAYARIKSIERKAIEKDVDRDKELKLIKSLNLTDPAEIDLAKHLIRYGEAIEAAVSDYRPNYLTTYLFELAQKFSVFYTNCPVLKAAPDKRPTRLLLCDLTAKTIKHGLTNLLGIDVVEQM